MSSQTSNSLSVNMESLRDAQKSLTRTRICDAARHIFSEQGYATATLEQIAHVAGTRRSTVYNHFRNKDDILGAIAEAYGEGLTRLIEELQGPVPSRSEIDRWLKTIVDFTVAEKIPTVLLMRLGDDIAIPQPLEELGRNLMQAMAVRLPVFRRAVEPGKQQNLALARATALVHQIGLACLYRIRHGDSSFAADMLMVAAEMFERLVQDDVRTANANKRHPSANKNTRQISSKSGK